MYNFLYSHMFLTSLFFITLIITIVYELWVFFYGNIKFIESDKLVELLNARNVIIFDFRNKNSFDLMHIASSLNVNQTTNFSSLKKKYHSKNIVVIEDYSLSKKKLVKFLYSKGFFDFYILKNGITDWSKNGFFLITKKSLIINK